LKTLLQILDSLGKLFIYLRRLGKICPNFLSFFLFQRELLRRKFLLLQKFLFVHQFQGIKLLEEDLFVFGKFFFSFLVN